MPVRSALVALLLALMATLAGCTSDGADRDQNDPTPSESPARSSLPIPDDVGTLVGRPPGVEAVAADKNGGVDGVVYDTTTGRTLADAEVVVSCLADTGPFAGSEVAVVPDDEGRFTIPVAAPFDACPQWSYTVEAAGYTMVVPISHGPVVETMWYTVYVGLEPDAT